MVREIVRKVPSGYLMIVLLFAAEAAAVYWFVRQVQAISVTGIILSAIVMIVILILWFGFFMVHPNEARVLQLFGAYTGTAREPGLRWANPLYMKRRISLRVRNFETGKMKVNDIDGNPIEIASIVVWRVTETAEACFHVDNYDVHAIINRNQASQFLAIGRQLECSILGFFEEVIQSFLFRSHRLARKKKTDHQCDQYSSIFHYLPSRFISGNPENNKKKLSSIF